MSGSRKDWQQFVFTAVLLSLMIAAAWAARGWPFGARLFPLISALLTIVLLLVLLLQQFPARRSPTSTGPEEGDAVEGAADAQLVLVTALSISGFAASVWLLGFQIGGPLAVLLYARGIGREGWLSSLLLASGSAVAVLLFSTLLQVPFPDPVLPLPGLGSP